VLVALRQQIVQVTAKLRLPGISTVRPFAEVGVLLSYGPDMQQMYRRAAELIDKILKGEKPADIPVEQVTKFPLIINLKAAEALEFDIPQTLLATADEVIE
jgi:putative ABC transport system substrate-binding protein